MFLTSDGFILYTFFEQMISNRCLLFGSLLHQRKDVPAMTVSKRDLNKPPHFSVAGFEGISEMSARLFASLISREKLLWLAYGITGALAFAALYLLTSTMVAWAQPRLSSISQLEHYMETPTYHLRADVGHGTSPGMLSHLTALNMDGQIVVVDFPGGDTERMRVLKGPYLFGSEGRSTPVSLRLEDMNGDTHSDLIVQVNNEEIIYINRDQSFQLVTPEERQEIIRQQSQAYQQ
jgi:hypothetical protein